MGVYFLSRFFYDVEVEISKGVVLINTYAQYFNTHDIFELLPYQEQLHCQRVKSLAMQIMSKMPSKPIDLISLSQAALYHDIGKTMVPYTILNKKGPLSHEERTIVQEHALHGKHILENIQAKQSVIDIVVRHHENFDGSGYPFSIAGSAISLEARILRVADVFDALHSKRIYKESFHSQKCLEIMESEKDYYDPHVFDALKSIVNGY